MAKLIAPPIVEAKIKPPLRDRLLFLALGLPHPVVRTLEAIEHIQKLYKRRGKPLGELNAEPESIRRLMRQLIDRDSACIDCGAHLGEILREIVRLSPRGRHLAIEPVPYKARWLARRYSQVEVAQCAAAGESGTGMLHYIPGRSALTSMTRDDSRVSIRLDVPMCTIDELVPRGRRIRFIKIDVEGMELPVLRGTADILVRHRPIILVESAPPVEADPGEILAYLASVGYRLWTPRDYLTGADPLDADAFAGARTFPFRCFNFVGAPT